MLPDPLVVPGGVVVEDSNPQVKYTGGWSVMLSDGGYSGGTLAMANDPTATISFTFEGTHVWYFADCNADHGRFRITIDNDTPTNMTSYKPKLDFVRSQYDRELEPGEHTIILHNIEPKVMALDFFVYRPIGFDDSPSSSGHTISRTSSRSLNHPSSTIQSQASTTTMTSTTTASTSIPVLISPSSIPTLLTSSSSLIIQTTPGCASIPPLGDNSGGATMTSAMLPTSKSSPMSQLQVLEIAEVAAGFTFSSILLLVLMSYYVRRCWRHAHPDPISPLMLQTVQDREPGLPSEPPSYSELVVQPVQSLKEMERVLFK